MSNKVKVPGGAFYLGDGLTVDPVTRTVSAGGGDVTTPDWNQNDATASDYIKNRPGGYDGQQQENDSGDYKFTYSNGKGTYNGSIATDIINNSQTVDVTIYNGSENQEFENVPVIQNSNGNYIGDINLIEYPFCFNHPEYEGGGSYGNYCYTNITPYMSGGSLNITVTGIGAVKPVKFDSKYIDVPSDMGKNNRTIGWDTESFAVGVNNYTGNGCFVVGTDNIANYSGFVVGTDNNVGSNSHVGIFGKNNNIGNSTFDSDGAVVVGQYSKKVGNVSERPTFIIGSGNSTTAATVFWADATTGHFVLPVVMTQVQPDTLILKSSTSGSKKKFKITVDDSGAITATETT